MKRLTTTLILLLTIIVAVAAGWQPDVLGDGYSMRYVDQGIDYSGLVRSTIVRKEAPESTDRAILYVHGYNDYFFQSQMGDWFVGRGISFYAVDLRKYGRSIMPGQKKFQARDLHEYFADIDSALVQMNTDGYDSIVIMGHSTGGLITALYVNEHPDTDIKGLILNSPFLEWNFNGFMRNVAFPTVSLLGRIAPSASFSQGNSSVYSQSLLKQYHGEWTYNTDWKLTKPQKVEASWIKAISSAQKSLKRHGDIAIPVLLMHSDVSLHPGDTWSADVQRADIVLNVKDISKLGRALGPDVTEDVIPGGLHDLSLSQADAREKFYADIANWLQQKVGW